MSLDAVTLAAIRHDLDTRLRQARIERIFQPARTDLLFQLRRGAEEFKLYFAAETPYPWLGLVNSTMANPANPPAFCMLLRKYLTGGRILGFLQPPFERVLSLEIEHYDELGGLVRRKLHFEFLGRRGNAVLAGPDGLILDALRRTPAGSSRPLEPGEAYEYPRSPGRLNPAELAAGTLANLLAHARAGQTLLDLLHSKLMGLSPRLLSGLIAEAQLDPQAEAASLPSGAADRLWQTIHNLASAAMEGRFAPQLVQTERGESRELIAFPFAITPGETAETVASLGVAIGSLLGMEAGRQRLESERTRLMARVTAELAKAERKAAKQEEELAAAAGAEEYKVRGDLLLSRLGQVPRGVAEVELSPWTEPDSAIKIVLNPSLTPSGNAQAYFRRYQRARRGQIAIAAHLEKTRADLAYLRGLRYMLAAANSTEELAEIAGEMAAERLLPKAAKPAAATRASGPRRFRSRDGLEILVGRNNRQNERVTFTLAAPGDTWLHTREIPGSHVIVKAGRGTPPPETLADAANLAVHFSQARTGSKVPVDYTERRHVRKQPGGHPGAVHYDHFATVIIDPDPTVLDRLLGQEESRVASPESRVYRREE